jgi:group I intron endonuclease
MIGVTFNMNVKSLAICPRTNGIYKITNIKTGRFYIGKSAGKDGFYCRWREHRRKLRANAHCCTYLQNSYNKHGESCFTFEVLEIRTHGENLFGLESEYIVNLMAMYFQNGYNMTNKRFTEKFPEIDRENHHRAKEFELLDPQGNLVKGKNLNKFCEDLGANTAAMWHVVKGEFKSYMGYKSPNLEFQRIREYRLLSPEKKLIIFDNMAEFARQIGTYTGSIRLVLNGERSNIKGYHLEVPSTENQKHLNRLFNKKLLVNNSLGIIVRFVSMRAFSRKYKASNASLQKFFAGQGNRLMEDYNWSVPTDQDMQLYPILEETF